MQKKLQQMRKERVNTQRRVETVATEAATYVKVKEKATRSAEGDVAEAAADARERQTAQGARKQNMMGRRPIMKTLSTCRGAGAATGRSSERFSEA